MKTGKVYLVGAGPGDPKLLTLRGKECLEQAEVVIYDYLANPALLEHVRPEAERIYVGRRGRGEYGDQAEINRLMIDRARAGKIVVRLKGGDPFVFGRGGEEAEAVAEAAVPFEVVPGVTSAVAAPAYAGIPVTHRTLASSVALVTGHEDPLKPSPTVEWDRLASTSGTDVLWGAGARVLTMPTIAIVPPADWRPLDRAIGDLAWYDWVIFTSVNGVRFFFERLRALGRDARALGRARFAAIGPKTAEALAGQGFKADVVPDEYQAEGVLEAFKKEDVKGVRILIPRAEVARDLLPEELRARGADVTVAVAYRTVRPEADGKALKEQLRRREVGVVTFTSSSSVRNYVELFADQAEASVLTANAVVACIGPITAETAESCGLKVGIRSKENTIPALAEAIVSHFAHSSCDV